MSDQGQPKSIARSLGEFFGHVIHGVKTDPARKVVKTSEEVEERTTPEGQKVILRRTIVEEVEVRPQDIKQQPGA
ncbi:MAG TPA: hypothetical protein VK176_09835 [Phycisphaerales bacterium]|nr:hypothetical protein [Phycisphaerales bacterium]